MRRPLLAFLVLAAACAPTTTASPSPATTGSPTASGPSATTTAPPTVAPTTAPTPTPFFPGPLGDIAPVVNVSPAVFPIMTSLRLRLAAIDDQVIGAARWGVERYLFAIDAYRNGRSPALPITGAFLDAVSTALKESATPGVTRKFEIESLTVDRHIQKPWGTHAYVEVTVTLVDRAVDGNAPDQRETGRLRLAGDKMFVTDGWDYEHARWFNGFGPLPLEQVRTGVAEAVRNYLGWESWASNGAPQVNDVGATSSAFQRARGDRVSVRARQVTSQIFENVSATIEQFETIEGIWSGLATVHVAGTVVTTSASGQTTRAPFERRVQAFVLGNWSPEIVDEQTPSGRWASGGDLVLQEIDVNRA